MPGPFTTTQLSFLAFVYAGWFAIEADVSATVLLAVIGSIAVLLALYTVLCTPAVVFLADCKFLKAGQDQADFGQPQ